MLRTIVSLIFLPFRILLQFWRMLIYRFRKGDHFFLEVPSTFSYERKSLFVRMLVSKDESPFFIDFLLGLRTLSLVPGLKKVSFLFEAPEYGFGEAWNLCKSIQALNEKGIVTAGFSLGGGTKSLLLLSYCKERYASSASEFFPTLPSAEPYFFGETAKKAGVGVETYASGAFKSFGETFQRSSFSAPAKKNLENLLKDQNEFLKKAFLETSGLPLSVLEEPIISSEALHKVKFLTDLLEEDEFQDNYLYEGYIREEEAEKSGTPNYRRFTAKGLRLYSRLQQFNIVSKSLPILAILPIQGNILPDLGREEEFRSRQVSYRYYQSLLKELKDDPKVGAVVLEMNSPGGSALVSELLYREIRKLAEKKPVFTYVLNVAASGGYYLACGTEEIHATPYSVVGSIGAVMLRFDLKGLYNKLGIKKERISFYPYRDILSEYGKLGAKSSAFLKKEVSRSRDLFYSRVTEARKTTNAELESKWGEGRIFLGQTFLKAGFLDSCSSFLELLERIKEKLNLSKVDVRYLPGTYTWKDLIQEMKPSLSFTALDHFGLPTESKKLLKKQEILFFSETASEISRN
ncbi:putative signal peptide peptidase SppA, 36K type [Leptospira fainei serovar Hurstbridge str. BUT 6]|uniref:Signal peptide peptidase SppA, 36K type n=1 Tax=Leptospira fainei serovar Hurstbridge str. BUT 6 TaxID=1193011 RepID=S3V1U9_9LEPT|nr:S49 family peptidase [Leptospira fainei]EPG75398.1 putative signal peptide peptidase SppA, 36K type [Leptospira fainei serovar Hurstbridge str. BUT 6]